MFKKSDLSSFQSKFFTELPYVENPLEKVRKHIDAQIAYNRSLAEQILKGEDNQEICEIIISMFVNLNQLPIISLPEEETIKKLKQDTVKRIFVDLKENNRLKEIAANAQNQDQLFLTINFNYKIARGYINNTSEIALKETLGHFYSGPALKKVTKQILKNIKCNNLNTPIMAEINLLREMSNILTPEVNPYCIRYIEDVEIYAANDLVMIELTDSIDKFDEKFLRLSNSNPHQELLPLNKANIAITNTLRQINAKGDLLQQYLEIFQHMVLKYELENQLTQTLRKHILKEKAVQLAKKKAQRELAPEKKQLKKTKPTVASTSTGKDKHPSSKKDTAPVVISANTPTGTPISKEIAEESLAIVRVEPETISLENFPTVIPLQSSLPLHISAEQTQIEEISEKPTLIMTNQLKEIKKLEKVEKQEFANANKNETETETDINTNYQAFAKPRNKPLKELKVKTQSTKFNLNKDDKKTLFQIFGLMEYDVISLRALVNLARGLGATIKTTSANRCRIELKNIYAHLLMTEEALSQTCNKATITMHGGGHRKYHSQNHDREKAPRYLIDQFKSAFERAGYTPDKLGLEVSSTSQNYGFS